MAASSYQGATDPDGQLPLPNLVGAQYKTRHRRSVARPTPGVGRGFNWTRLDHFLIHVLLNEYDFSDDETTEIFHRISGARDAGSDLSFDHLRKRWSNRWHDSQRTDHMTIIDRPNRWNTTPYNPNELTEFANTRNAIEAEAASLGFNIQHQSGISSEGVQVDLMHDGSTGPILGMQLHPTTAAPETRKLLSMVHRSSLRGASPLGDWTPYVSDIGEIFHAGLPRVGRPLAHDHQAYMKGGEVKRVHFAESLHAGSFFAHVMICDVGACRAADCASEFRHFPVLNTTGKPFVHSIRDCSLSPDGVLTFDPGDDDNAKFCELLPAVQAEVPVIFRNTRQQDVEVKTSICKWDEWSICKELIDEEAIAEWRKQGRSVSTSSTDPTGSQTKGNRRQWNSRRPFSIRERSKMPNSSDADSENVASMNVASPTQNDQQVLTGTKPTLPYDHSALYARRRLTLDMVSEELERHLSHFRPDIAARMMESLSLGVAESSHSDDHEQAPITSGRRGSI